MMDPFQLRDRVVGRYGELVRSFQQILDPEIRAGVEAELDSGLLWPEPHVALNPSFESGGLVDDLVREGLLQEECRRIVVTTGTGSGKSLTYIVPIVNSGLRGALPG